MMENIKNTKYTSGLIMPNGDFYGCEDQHHIYLIEHLLEQGILKNSAHYTRDKILMDNNCVVLTTSYMIDVEFRFSFRDYDDEMQYKITPAQIQAMLDYKIGKCENIINFNFKFFFLKDLASLFIEGNLNVNNFGEKTISNPKKIGNKAKNLEFLKREGINVPKFFIIDKERAKSIVNGDYYYLYNNLSDVVSVRSSPLVSMPGIFDTYLNVNNNKKNIIESVKNIYGGLKSKKAQSYKEIFDIWDYDFDMGVIVQDMINTSKGIIGVLTIDDSKIDGVYLQNDYGHNLMSGKKTPKELHELPDDKLIKITETANKIYNFFLKKQEIEFAFDEFGQLWILQTRDTHNEKNKNWNLNLNNYVLDFVHKGYSVYSGKSIGKVVFDEKDIKELNEPYIIFNQDFDYKDINLLNKSNGFCVSVGGKLSHIANIANKLEIPCISNLDFKIENDTLVFLNGKKIKKFEEIIINHNQIFKNKKTINY